jgi:hypothetical protein
MKNPQNISTLEKLKVERESLFLQFEKEQNDLMLYYKRKDILYKKNTPLLSKQEKNKLKISEIKSKINNFEENGLGILKEKDELENSIQSFKQINIDLRNYFKKYDYLREEISSKIQEIKNIQKGISKINNMIFVEYVLSCPYSDEKEIKKYLHDFVIDHEEYLDYWTLFKVFRLTFNSGSSLDKAGKFYRIISQWNQQFHIEYKRKIPYFFKNVIFSDRNNGIKIKSKEEYKKFEYDFNKYFKLNLPDKCDVLKAILDDEKAINKIKTSDFYYNLMEDLFKNKCPEIFKELNTHITDLKKLNDDELM